MISTVKLAKAARKALRKSPEHIVVKLLGWVDLVENEGLAKARMIPGYHDEPLRGRRRGQRSIRLSHAWRAVYAIEEPVDQSEGSFVLVTEVSKHDY